MPVEQNNPWSLIGLEIRECLETDCLFFKDEPHHHSLVPRIATVLRIVETEVAQSIENGPTFICLITADTVLMMVDNGICPGIDEEAERLLHPQCGQLIFLYATMGNDNHIVGFRAGLTNGIILPDRIQGIGSPR